MPSSTSTETYHWKLGTRLYDSALQALMTRVQMGTKFAIKKFRSGWFDGLKMAFDAAMQGDDAKMLSCAEGTIESLIELLSKLTSDEETEAMVLERLEKYVKLSFEMSTWDSDHDLDETVAWVTVFYKQHVLPNSKICQVRLVYKDQCFASSCSLQDRHEELLHIRFSDSMMHAQREELRQRWQPRNEF